MKILIDGYNLVFAWGWMPVTESPQASAIARNRLIEKLKHRIPVSVRDRFTIVFDVKGFKSSRDNRSLSSGVDPSGFNLRFAYDYPDADALIEEMIRQESTPNRLIVVSTDRRLRTAAERRQAISVRSEDFLDSVDNIVHQLDSFNQRESEALSKNSKQQAIEGLKDIDWLAEFGIEQTELGIDQNELGLEHAKFDQNIPNEELQSQSVKEKLESLIDSNSSEKKKKKRSRPKS